MNRIFVTSVIMFVVSFSQIMGQTTTTSRQSQVENGKIETYTRTETLQSDGRTITTTTYTSTVNMSASFGVKANANMSDFIIRDVDDYQSNGKFGASAGIFLKLESRGFALQYELALRYRSCGVENNAEHTKTDYQYWGLELPIYLMGQINAGQGKFFIGAGPYLGFGLDATRTPGNVDLYKKDKTTGKSIMHRWDFGLGAIAGYEFKNGIIINGSYQAGFINALSAEKDAMTMKCRMVSLGIGYKF